jgi:hypothetical protein
LSQSQARKIPANPVCILPQVAPLQAEKGPLRSERYVLDSIDSRLAPLHFRNQVYLLPKYFADFQALAEATWPGLRVMEPEVTSTDSGVTLSLYIRDHDFQAEVGSMGRVEQFWKDPSQCTARVPGKEVLSGVAGWSERRFDVSFGAATVAKKSQSMKYPLMSDAS